VSTEKVSCIDNISVTLVALRVDRKGSLIKIFTLLSPVLMHFLGRYEIKLIS
jgi:hypothetical protein